MPNDELVNEIISGLQNEDRAVNAMRTILGEHLVDARLLAPLESLLNSREITTLGIPFSHGEVRWKAAQVLAFERKACGIFEPVILYGVMKPMNDGEVAIIVKNENIPPELLALAAPVKLKFLMEKGKIPLYDMEFTHEGRRILREYTDE
jgi:hypothetical protein